MYDYSTRKLNYISVLAYGIGQKPVIAPITTRRPSGGESGNNAPRPKR
jgi:hypothetical protein